MAAGPGAGARRWPAPRRRSIEAPSTASPIPPKPPAGQPVQATAPETADIYRSLFNQLREKFGGDIDDVNAQAIAFAAAELYHKDVEPRLWEQKTAEEILDSFGVPRAGTFIRYSLSDRLLLLRQSANASRTEQAEALLTELGAPEYDSTGSRIPLKDRLQRLLEGTGPRPPIPGPADLHAEGEDGSDDPPEAMAAGDPSAGGQQLQSALDTIGDAAPPQGGTSPSAPVPPPSPDAPLAELVGLGTVIAGIQEELIRLREEIETVKGRLDEALALLRAPTAGTAPAAVASDGGTAPAPAQATIAEAPVAYAVPAAAPIDPDDRGDQDPPATAGPEPARAAAADEETQLVPVVVGDGALDPPPPEETGRRRRRGLPALIVFAAVVGLMIAGIAIAILMFGWTEVRRSFEIGAVDVHGVSARDLAERLLDPLDRPRGAG